MIEGFNNNIACAPFEKKSVETKVSNAFGTVAQKVTLTKLRVIYGNDKIPAGALIYVKGDTMKHVWANEEFEVDGQTVILVPQASVFLVDFPLPPANA
jgi:hypothetical protein